jgi:hypothetical protein
LVSIATVVFGAALLIQGGAMLTEFALIESGPEKESAAATGGGALFLVGFAGVVLGVLALLGVHAPVLTAVSAIAFGTALVISSSAVWQLLTSRSVAARFQTRSPMLRVMGSEVAAGSSGLQAMAGLAVIVLGILAIAGIFTGPLTLIAFLVAGAALVLTGSTLSATMTGFMRPTATARRGLLRNDRNCKSARLGCGAVRATPFIFRWSASFSRYQRTAFLDEPRDGGAQAFDPCAGVGGGCDQIGKCRRSFCNCGFDGIAASSESGLADLVAFRQHDLVADGGLAQYVKHGFVAGFQSVARVDQHINAGQVHSRLQVAPDQPRPPGALFLARGGVAIARHVDQCEPVPRVTEEQQFLRATGSVGGPGQGAATGKRIDQ